MLKKGDKGPEVKELQEALNEDLPPHRKLREDGDFGAKTHEAVVEFQKKKGLPGTGIVDGKTKEELLKKKHPQGEVVISGKPLPPVPRQVLTEILQNASLHSAVVTSVERSPYDKARVMYENIKSKGLAYNYKLYAAAGDAVVKVYEENPGKSREDVIRLMEAKVKELGPSKVSKHCSTSHYVFD